MRILLRGRRGEDRYLIAANLARQRRAFGLAREDLEFGVDWVSRDGSDEAEAERCDEPSPSSRGMGPSSCARHARRG